MNSTWSSHIQPVC